MSSRRYSVFKFNKDRDIPRERASGMTRGFSPRASGSRRKR